jgi:phosphate transport system protein
MPKNLDRDLNSLQRHLLMMAGYVEESITKSIQALQDHDRALAANVVSKDDQVDDLDNIVTEECLKILALYQPVASDLRRIAVVLMITTDLERMGDLAIDIAERAISLAALKQNVVPNALSEMMAIVTSMVRQSLDAFVNLDGKSARRVIRLDDEVDRFNTEIIAELIARMKTSPDQIEPNLSLFSAVRHLERIADHATNIAEDVLFLLDGEIVRHRASALSDDG